MCNVLCISSQVSFSDAVFLHFYFLLADCPTPEIGEDKAYTFKSLETNDFPEGSQVTLVCRNGYEKESGSGLMNCTDGKWTEPDLVCNSESCLTCILHLMKTVIQHA